MDPKLESTGFRTTSQHGVISFEIDLSRNNEITQEEGEIFKYNVKILNIEKIKRNLILPQIEHEINLDELATNLENTTTNAIESSTPPNINEAKKTPFWTRKLIKLKQQLKASRKSYKVTGDHRLRQTRLEKYRQIKQQYEKEVYNTKKKTWSTFVEENISTDVWGMGFFLWDK